MAKHTGKHTAKQSKAAGVAAFLVLMFSGFLLATNLRVNRSVVVTNDTAELVGTTREKSQLPADGSRRAQLPRERSEQNPEQPGRRRPARQRKRRQRHHAASGGRPGLVVTLDDSPLWENMVDSSGSTSNINDYVVHQQDVEAVVNALWAGGAESMMIMDQRVLFNSAVRCSGNVLLLQGKVFAAIHHFRDRPGRGNEKGARQFAGSDHIPAVRQRVRLGWQVDEKEKLHFDATDALQQPLQYAQAMNNETDGSQQTDETQESQEGK